MENGEPVNGDSSNRKKPELMGHRSGYFDKTKRFIERGGEDKRSFRGDRERNVEKNRFDASAWMDERNAMIVTLPTVGKFEFVLPFQCPHSYSRRKTNLSDDGIGECGEWQNDTKIDFVFEGQLKKSMQLLLQIYN